MTNDFQGMQKFHIESGTRLADFYLSNNFVDVIEGPIGSGKTVALCLRLMRHAQQQQPSPIDGLRKSRFFIARNTYPDLKKTTIKTWLDCFPEHIYGRFNSGAILYHRMRFDNPLGNYLIEVDFLALDKPEDVRKLRSAEYTGGAFNELAFIPKELFDEATSRVNRYPKQADGGPTWHGVIADTNAPDEDHWLGMMTGQVDLPPGLPEEERSAYKWPPDWGFFMQPPAVLEKLDEHGRVVDYEVNEHAENISNLAKGYYKQQLAGKSKAWIDSRLMVRVVLVVDGSPVWPSFRTEVHVAREVLSPVPGHPVHVGLDFGRQPAAIFIQSIGNRTYVQYELVGNNEGAVTFAPKVKRFLAQHYPDHRLASIYLWGDPKGQDRGQTDDRTAYDVFRANDLPVRPAPNLRQNMIATRVDAVTKLLNEMHDGRPRFVLSPYCRTLKIGMAGRYHLIKEETGELRPKKDRYADVCDALQYGVLGLGEGRAMIGLGNLNEMRPVKAYQGKRTMRRLIA